MPDGQEEKADANAARPVGSACVRPPEVTRICLCKESGLLLQVLTVTAVNRYANGNKENARVVGQRAHLEPADRTPITPRNRSLWRVLSVDA